MWILGSRTVFGEFAILTGYDIICFLIGYVLQLIITTANEWKLEILLRFLHRVGMNALTRQSLGEDRRELGSSVREQCLAAVDGEQTFQSGRTKYRRQIPRRFSDGAATLEEGLCPAANGRLRRTRGCGVSWILPRSQSIGMPPKNIFLGEPRDRYLITMLMW